MYSEAEIISHLENHPYGVISPATLKRIYDMDTSFIGVPNFGKTTAIMKNGLCKDLYYLKRQVGFVVFCGFVYNVNADRKKRGDDNTFVVGRALMESLWFKTCTKNILQRLVAGEKFEEWITVYLECLHQPNNKDAKSYWIERGALYQGIDTTSNADPPSSNVKADFAGIKAWLMERYDEMCAENAANEAARQVRVAAAIQRRELEEKRREMEELKAAEVEEEEKTVRAAAEFREIMVDVKKFLDKLEEEMRVAAQKKQDFEELINLMALKAANDARENAKLEGLIEMLGATKLGDDVRMEDEL